MSCLRFSFCGDSLILPIWPARTNRQLAEEQQHNWSLFFFACWKWSKLSAGIATVVPHLQKTRTPLPFPPVSQYRISTDRKVFRSCSELRKQPHLWRVWSMFLLMSQAPICLVRFIHSCNRIPWVADIVGTQLGDKNATEAGCDWNYYNAVLWMNERSLLGEWTMVGWWGFTGSVATQAACYLRGDWFDGWRR